MNLATRCLSCGTVFRVGEAQLQASEGWVRCGRCDGVFNAAEVLFDIDSGAPLQLALPSGSDAPAAAPAPASRPDPRVDPPARTAYPDEPLLRAPSRTADELADDEPIVITDHVAPPAPAAPATPAPAAPFDGGWAGRDAPAPPPAAAPPALPAAGMVAAATAASLPQQPLSTTPAAAPVQAAPSFLRQAERAALWRHPAMRGGLWAGVLLLALAMLLQMALLWRDSLAARLPGTAPALQALCRLAGCSVLPLRRIQQLSVASSGLNRLEGSSLYRLQLVLQNRADTPVMVPALDLTLTDPQGQLVARRVLQLAELGVPQAALQAGQDLPIKVLVSTSERRVEGYTLELFYP
ncbi:MAG: zinc-ribbon and DUF3426 domain-containing protein [Pseudomonadota bacterium]